MTASRTLTDRTVCVTGASSGFGRAIAEHLGGLGAHVFLAGRTASSMEESSDTIRAAGGRADVAVFDITDTAALQGWIHGAAERTGRLDVMVNNAGFGDPDSVVDGDPDHWKQMFDVNVIALAVGCQAAITAMRATSSEGNIVNISSVAAIRRESGMYGATKHAVNNIGSSLRAELEDDAIRVTTIMPGAFATNFSRNMDPEMVAGFAAMAGIDDPQLDETGRFSQDQLDQMSAALSTIVGHPRTVAQAIEYVVTQPIEVNIEELVVRPQKSIF